jgi:hypothetical protein
MDLSEVGLSGMYWIYLAQDKDNWRALVKTIMKRYRHHHHHQDSKTAIFEP